MSIESAREWLARHAPELEVHEASVSTATVALAAEAHGVEPARIAKSLALWHDSQPILIVMSGEARLDNRRYKERFGLKARMLNAEEVMHWTGHPVGGVCPFGLAHPLPVYLDESLRRFDVVLPAAGSLNSMVRAPTHRLAELFGNQWVDVGKAPEA